MSGPTKAKLFEVMRLGPIWQLASAESVKPELLLPKDEPVTVGSYLPSNLDELATLASNCQRCELCETRKKVVFSDGQAKAPIMVIGEAPGADEDATGLPFVGQAGQLLERMLAAIECSRKTNVYIANVIKCRPPQNRDPNSEELAQCIGFLHQQIQLVKPKVIVLVGKVAITNLLATNSKVAEVRGKVHQLDVNGFKVNAVATYHPAYLLRSPAYKSAAWEDLLLVKKLAAG